MKYGVICCYYGVLPNYFKLWLEGASLNTELDFLFITDRNTISEYESDIKLTHNIKIIYISFDSLKERIQNLFDFTISLDKPYKLCDFRMAYGIIFEQELKKYDYFGWFDLDVIQGDFKLLFDEDLNEYDIIGENGHLTLLKNNNQMKYLFYKSAEKDNNATPYKFVFSSQRSCFFDEAYGLRCLTKNLKVKRFSSLFVDIYPFRTNFTEWYNNEEFILRKDRNTNKLYCIKNHEIKEIMYVHLQKRKMEYVDISNANKYYIVPNTFTETKKFMHLSDKTNENKEELRKFRRVELTSKLINFLINYYSIPKRIVKKYFVKN